MDPSKLADFNAFLHELRTRELAKSRGRAGVLLSAGCSGAWYFDWIQECLGPSLRVHIGVEAYSPRPETLPPEARWIDNPITDMRDVASGGADMVFAGQTVEHLWPHEFTGFMLEAHRVLRPRGLLVLDSPNRELTWALNWHHPEHTMEFTVPEIRELVELAGFRVTALRGVWLCREGRNVMRLEPLPEPPPWPARVEAAVSRAEDSFVWWLEAVRDDRGPQIEKLGQRLGEIFAHTRPHDLARAFHAVGSTREDAGGRWQEAQQGEAGYLAYGPYAPFPPGAYAAHFQIRTSARSRSADPACKMDVATDCGRRVITSYQLRCCDVEDHWEGWQLRFRLKAMQFGLEFRLLSTGQIPIALRIPIQIEQLSE